MLTPYRGLLATSFKNAFAYRWAVIAAVFRNVLAIFVQLALWRYVFRNDQDLARYMTAYVVASRMLAFLMNNGASYLIANQVVTGAFAYDLLRPVNALGAYWSRAAGETLATMVNRGLPVLAAFSWTFVGLGITPPRVLLVFLFAFLGYILSHLIYILLGYLAFVFLGVGPFVRITDALSWLMSGSFVPIAFFPPWLAAVASVFPFRFLYSLPIRLLLESVPAAEVSVALAIIFAWIAVLTLFVVFVAQRAVRHAVVQGG